MAWAMALAFAVAGNGDNSTALNSTAAELVRGIAECQAAVARGRPDLQGYVSAYGIDHIE